MEEELKTPENQPVTPQVPQTVNKKSNVLLISVLLVVVLLIGITGGVYASKFLNQPKACTMEAKFCPDGSSVGHIGPNCEFAPCSTQAPATTTIPDETANWKTYTNTKYGFEFKYLPSFQNTNTSGLGQNFLDQKPVIELENGVFNYLHNQINAYFIVSVKSNAKSECEYVPRGVLNTLKNKVINGINFTVFSTGGAATGNTYSNTILHYLKDSTCYEIVTTIHESSDGNTPEALPKINEQKAIFNKQLDQILSTFKFIPDDKSCIAEGGKGNYANNLRCCQSLVEVSCYPSSDPPCAAMESTCFSCIKCGDGKCGNGETKCNCPSDCN